MELSEKERERIKEEERARMEARREYLHGSWGGMHGGCGWHRGHGVFRFLALLAVIFAVAHFWHRECRYDGYGYAPVQPPAVQSAPAAPVRK